MQVERPLKTRVGQAIKFLKLFNAIISFNLWFWGFSWSSFISPNWILFSQLSNALSKQIFKRFQSSTFKEGIYLHCLQYSLFEHLFNVYYLKKMRKLTAHQNEMYWLFWTYSRSFLSKVQSHLCHERGVWFYCTKISSPNFLRFSYTRWRAIEFVNFMVRLWLIISGQNRPFRWHRSISIVAGKLYALDVLGWQTLVPGNVGNVKANATTTLCKITSFQLLP